MKLGCFAEISASPMRCPRSPTWSMSHQAGYSRVFLKMEPALRPRGCAACRLAVQLHQPLRQLVRVRRLEQQVRREDDVSFEELSREGALAVAQAELVDGQLVLEAVLADHPDALEHRRQAAVVGAGVVDDGAADGAGDAARPLEAGEALARQVAGQRGDAGAGLGAEDGAAVLTVQSGPSRPRARFSMTTPRMPSSPTRMLLPAPRTKNGVWERWQRATRRRSSSAFCATT